MKASGSDYSQTQWRLAGWGAFLLVLALYLFSHPGRIDIIDGQFRFEVSKNIINLNGPVLSDYWLIQGALPTNPTTGNHYSYYTAPASLFPIPLMILSRAVLGSKVTADMFSFSMASAFAGAAIAPLIIAFYRKLKTPLPHALAWTAVFTVSTLWWPGSVTVFDQCQHGVVVLAMTLAAYDAAKSGRLGSALATGLLGGLLFNYRIPFITLLPFYPAYWIVEARRREGGIAANRSGLFLQIAMMTAGVMVGIAGYLFYNWIRFGQIQMAGFAGEPPAIGNPLAGFLTLIVSPGKGLLWFSAPIFLAAFGMKGLFKAERGLGWLIVGVSILHTLEMSCLNFAGGDWCWGPRYMIPILPLWALFFPYIKMQGATKRISFAVIAAGFFAQILGVSQDQHRFFFYRHLAPHFWIEPWCYFKFSQLAARPGELVESFQERNLPRSGLNSNPQKIVTYCPFGPPGPQNPKGSAKLPAPTHVNDGKKRSDLQILLGQQASRRLIQSATTPLAKRPSPPDAIEWTKGFAIFYLPRPWWGWINRAPIDQRPVNPVGFFAVCAILAGAGGLIVRKSLRTDDA